MPKHGFHRENRAAQPSASHGTVFTVKSVLRHGFSKNVLQEHIFQAEIRALDETRTRLAGATRGFSRKNPQISGAQISCKKPCSEHVFRLKSVLLSTDFSLKNVLVKRF